MNRNSRLLAYAQLVRLPNVFTAAAEVSMGFLVVHNSLQPIASYLCLLFASCLLYMSGMVFNDVLDYETDMAERPERPLPSGRITRQRAAWLGVAMLLAGVALGWCAGFVSPSMSSVNWRPGVIATTIALCIVAYDGFFKETVMGPLWMGSCRLLNVLLGMSTGVVMSELWPQFGFDSSHLVIAAGIGIYVVGVTWFARQEAVSSNRGLLLLGIFCMTMGLAFLALFPQVGAFESGEFRISLRSPLVWTMLVAVLGFSIIRRCLVAVRDPQPRLVQLSVKQCIVSLIVIDAAVCLAVCRPVWWSLAVVSLMIPMLVIGRWVYST